MKFDFQEYKEQRDLIEFDQKFTKLCESIVISGITFDEFWEQHGLPVLLESNNYPDEEKLLVEFNWGMFNPMNWGTPAPAQAPQQAQPLDPAKQQKLDKFQKKIDQQIGVIKQRFNVSMKDFLKAVTDDAKTQSDPHMWQIAKSFHKKIMDTAKPVMDEFQMKAKFGKAGYTDQFSQQAQLMKTHQQNDRTNNMVKRYNQQFRDQQKNQSVPQTFGGNQQPPQEPQEPMYPLNRNKWRNAQ
jgi:hypothetical protein